MRFPILYELRALRDDQVDRLEVEVLRGMERTSTNSSRTLPSNRTYEFSFTYLSRDCYLVLSVQYIQLIDKLRTCV